MKKITVRTGQIINSIFAGILTLLGFSSCDDEECMYGTPTGYYEIKGTVTEESGRAVEGAKIIMRLIYGNSAHTAWGDTVITDNKGEYMLKSRSVWAHNKIRMVCKPESDTLETDSINMTVSFKGGDGVWDQGTAKETVDFRLKSKK